MIFRVNLEGIFHGFLPWAKVVVQEILVDKRRVFFDCGAVEVRCIDLLLLHGIRQGGGKGMDRLKLS